MNLRSIRSSFLPGLLVLALCLFAMAPVARATDQKKIVAVSRFENKTSWKGQVSLDDGMADQLTDALMHSGQFVVLERQTLSDVTAEQDLAASGRAAASKSAQTGKLTSAQVLVKGAITEFENASSGSASGIGFGGFKVGNNRQEAHVGLIIRLIDTTTGQVLDSERVEGKAASGGVKFGMDVAGVDFGTEGFKKTPLGKAVQIAIDNAVNIIASKLKTVPFEARVIKINGDEIYISGGARTGMAVGDEFTAYSVGEAMVDPDTGEQLGSEQTKRGLVKVFEVQEKFAKARADGPLSGNLKTGDIVRGQ